MPIYEYRCSACGFQKEYLQKVSDPLLKTCPECKKDSFSKMLSAAGFQLKGSGWYATDFKNNSSSSKPTSTDTKDKGESKAESRSEAPSSTAGASSSC
jgi:putative FmdB family regulatory protein